MRVPVRCERRLPCRAAANLLAAIVMLIVGQAHAQPNLDQIVRQFEVVALGHEHGEAVGYIQKWPEDVSLALFAAPNWDVQPYLTVIGRHLSAIEGHTGIQVRAARNVETATLRLGFYPRADFVRMPGPKSDPDYRRWIETSACIALAVGEGNGSGHIVGGAIAIGTDIPEAQRQHCILEELVQVLGLANDACHYRPSLFCEQDRLTAMAPADTLLLRVLYDQRLPVGTPHEEAMVIVRELLTEMFPDLLAWAPQGHGPVVR